MVIPFQLITCGLFDDSLPNLLLGVPVLVYTGSILHARWGAVELARFLAVANVLMACLSWLSMIVLYVLFRDEHFLFARLGGVSGALGALAVALRQQALRAPPPPAGAAPSPAALLAPHAPALQLAASAALLVVAHAGPPDELLFAVHGLFVGWLYLRYYQPQPSGAWGDASDAFAFAALFPPAVQPPLRALGRVTFGVASACGCCPLSGWAPPIDEGAGRRAPQRRRARPPRLGARARAAGGDDARPRGRRTAKAAGARAARRAAQNEGGGAAADVAAAQECRDSGIAHVFYRDSPLGDGRGKSARETQNEGGGAAPTS